MHVTYAHPPVYLKPSLEYFWGFLGGSVVKKPLPLQEPQNKGVGSLGWEDPLKEGMATHSSILAWRILRTEEPGRLQSMGSQRVGDHRNHFECTCMQSISDT